MRNETRAIYSAYLAQQAKLNNVPNAADKFSVAPSIQQKLETEIQESSAFLSAINLVPVNEMKGEKLGLGVTGPIASRTDTSGAGERATSDVATLDSQKYECQQTNYDTHIRYNTLDSWAKFPDFQTRVRDVVLKRCALDRMMIGFNGTSAAATTNRSTYPMLQDVNIGWLQSLRTNAPDQVLAQVGVTGKITVRAEIKNADNVVTQAAGDYKSLDALVYDAAMTLLAPWYQEDPGLVAIVGRDLMHDKLFPLVADPTAPTETLAADIVRSQRRLGGLPALALPFFPAGKVLITRLDNLSIYYQDGARRRAVTENPKKDCIEHFESSNDAFVVEDFGLACLVENIELLA